MNSLVGFLATTYEVLQRRSKSIASVVQTFLNVIHSIGLWNAVDEHTVPYPAFYLEDGQTFDWSVNIYYGAGEWEV